MQVQVTSTHDLTFEDGSPVRAASAIVAYDDGWLIAQDDSTIGAHWSNGRAVPLRLLESVDGHDTFSSGAGTKELKPDLEAACVLPDGTTLVLGSGSSEARCRAVVLGAGEPRAEDLTALYERVGAALSVSADVLNLEGACVVEGHLRWFHRGLPAAGWPSASVDLPLDVPLIDAHPAHVLRYDLGAAHGIGLAVTDAVSLDDGRVLVSAAAEDSPNTYDDGPVVGSALVLLAEDSVVGRLEIPPVNGRVAKVEGLGLLAEESWGVRLLATVDADDHDSPSPLVELAVRW